MTTHERIEAIRQREAAAIPGPWESCGAGNGNCECGLIWHKKSDAVVATAESCKTDECGEGFLPEVAKHNERFISNARADIPFLLSEFDRLRAALAKYGKHLHHTCDADSCTCGFEASSVAYSAPQPPGD